MSKLVNISWTLHGQETIENLLASLSAEDYRDVVSKNLTDMFNRGSKTGASGGGTPVKTGVLRTTRNFDMKTQSKTTIGTFGYTREYAPHVEHGHRTRGGRGYVPGQKYLKQNMEKQWPIYREDMAKRLKELL